MKNIAAVLALGGALSSAAFATANSCGTPSAAPPSGTLNPTTYITLATANLVDDNEMVSPTNAGCQVTNKVFDNFAVSGTGTGALDISGNAISTGSIIVLGIDPATVGIQQRLSFSPTTTNLAVPEPAGTIATTGVDWSNITAGNTTVTTIIDFLVTPVLNSGTFGLRGMGVDYTSLNGDDQIVITVQACFNTTTACSASPSFTQTFTFNPTGTSDQALTRVGSAFSSFQSANYTVRVTASLDDNGGSGITLNNFYLEFEDTPEPSTFGMLGAALAGLGIMARKRRKS
jgi:hypothetical protein